MKNFLMTSVVFLLINAWAGAADNGILLRSEFKLSGKRYIAFIHESDMQGVPLWLEKDPWPPLAIRLAVKHAKEELSKEWPQFRDWRLETVALTPLSERGQWVYVIEFTPVPMGPVNGMILPVKRIVKLDGKTVPFKKEN